MNSRIVVQRINSRLAEIRMPKGEFYNAAGITSAGFSNWNTNDSVNIPLSKLKKIAEILGVSVDWLTGEEKAATQKGDGDIETILNNLYFLPLDRLLVFRDYLDKLIELKKLQDQIDIPGADSSNT